MVRDGTIRVPGDNFWLGAVALFAGVAATCGSEEQQRILRTALTPRADRLCVFGTGGAVFGTGHHWLARLALALDESDAARRHLSLAATICEDADAAYWADRARRESSTIGGPASIEPTAGRYES